MEEKEYNLLRKVAAKKDQIPVLMFGASDGKSITTTDLEVAVRVAGAFPEGLVPMNFKSFQLGTIAPEYNGHTVKDFPEVGAVEGPQLEVDAKTLKEVAKNAGKDITRPALTGVYLSCHGGKVIAQASDAYRLAHVYLGGGSGEWDAIVPVKAVKMLWNGKWTMTVGDVVAKFENGNTTITTKLIDAKFPDFKPLIQGWAVEQETEFVDLPETKEDYLKIDPDGSYSVAEEVGGRNDGKRWCSVGRVEIQKTTGSIYMLRKGLEDLDRLDFYIVMGLNMAGAWFAANTKYLRKGRLYTRDHDLGIQPWK